MNKLYKNKFRYKVKILVILNYNLTQQNKDLQKDLIL